MSQVEPWEKAAECERALRITVDPIHREALSNIREFWIALAQERRFLSDEALATQIEKIGGLQARLDRNTHARARRRSKPQIAPGRPIPQPNFAVKNRGQGCGHTRLAAGAATNALRVDQFTKHPSAQQGQLLRRHILISAWCARRRNNLEMTAARRRDLHVAVNPGKWADHAF